ISEAQITAWEKEWSAQVGSIELENGAGKGWTKEERQAGGATRAGPSTSDSTLLTAQSPAPQLVYYRPNAKATEPMLVKLQLRYRPTKNQEHVRQ
ncbi:MAG: hypothetical protein ACREBC_29555, partial [Pyrinomonadaceae bacterium]